MQSRQTKINILLICLLIAFCSTKVSAKGLNANIIHQTDTDTIRANPGKNKDVSFLALGDSYTIGQSVDSSERFPAQTATLLRLHGIGVHHIDYIATTGWKTVNLQWAIEAQKRKAAYDIVTLLIGVNDQYLKHDTTDYRAHFTNLLQKAIGYANGNKEHVFILSIPDYSVTPFGKEIRASAKQIDQFNAINKEVANGFGVSYTDITGISRYDEIDATMLAPDDLHPSGKQYEQWARALANSMLPVYQTKLY